jgi:hypothetical protein
MSEAVQLFYTRSRDVVILDSASRNPNTSAQFSLCGLLIGFPCEGQQIDCKMPSDSR